MYCPSCRSTYLKKLALVYTSGLRNINTRAVGFGRGLYVGRNRGTSQSRLSQIAAPSRARSSSRVVIIWLLFGLVGGWMFAMVITAANPLTNRQKNPTIRRNQGNTRPSVEISPEVAIVMRNIAIGAGTAYVLLLLILLRSVRRYNRDVYSKAIVRWNSSFMCQSCGAIVEM